MYYALVLKPFGMHKKGEELIYPDYVAISYERRKRIVCVTKVTISKMKQKSCSLYRSYIKPKEGLEEQYLEKVRKMAREIIHRRKLLIPAPL